MSTYFQDACSVRSASLMVVLVALALCLQGCTSVASRELPHFETVSIGALEQRARRAKATTGRSHQKDAFAGGAVGMTAGAAASLACGPFFVLCAFVAVPTGAAVGGAAGLVAGVVVDDNLKKRFGDQFDELESILTDLRKRRDLQMEMWSAVTAAIPANRQVEPDKATALILVGPKKIELLQFNRTELAVRVTGELVARWDRRRRTNGGYKVLTFVHQTEARPIDHWLERNGFRIEKAYSDAVVSISNKMIAEIN